tara:strand:+ start:10 stop:309 length:300 start_codon:yes stop_codon:yes gene_type:complete
MFNKSIGHLKENNMSYGEHFIFGCTNGLHCIKAGFMLIIHSIIPACFSCAGANLTNYLNTVFTNDNELLSLKTRVEAFKKIVYHYRSTEYKNSKKECNE